jgi:hypothetical protein
VEAFNVRVDWRGVFLELGLPRCAKRTDLISAPRPRVASY